MRRADTLTTRQRAILSAVVESYIATGEPVSSGALARSPGIASGTMSSATIRNEMAELADAGLLEQPHTSAGRVPSAQAFRLYVDGLAGTPARLPGPTRAEVESRIDVSFAGVAGSQALLERTSQVLAALSSGVGVAVGAASVGDLLEHVHFSRLAERRVLAVLVTRSGNVRDRVLAIDRDLTAVELETAARYLNEHFRGWNLERIRAELAQRIELDRSLYQQMLQRIEQLWAGTLPASGDEGPSVYIEGMANLVVPQRSGQSGDHERLRELLSALEAKQRLVELLNACIDARQESVRVVFELEEQAPEMAGLVLIAAPARMAGETRGAVGVIGSHRMHYESTMNAVAYVAQVLNRVVDGQQD